MNKETLNEKLDELERLIESDLISRSEIAARYDELRQQAFASEHGSDDDYESFYERLDLSEAEWKDDDSIPAVSVGAAVSVEWKDGKVVLVVDVDTVCEGLRDLVSIGDLTEEQEDFLSARMCEGKIELAW